MSTIAFVGCVKAKRPGVHPAADKYTSPLFSKSRAYAERHADRWFILSAKHGLLDPAAPIDDYDETLNDMHAGARRAWAEKVVEQIRATRLLGPGDRVLWLAGRDYKDHVEALLPQVEHLDPMHGLGIGSRLGWLTRAIETPALPPEETPPSRTPAPSPRPTLPAADRPAPHTSFNARTSKYDPLRDHLASRREPRITLSFTEIESILGFPLPASARQYQAWWANETNPTTHVQKRSWTDAGYRVQLVTLSRTSGMVTFERAR